jgi:outer membrane protein assembly factor BamD
MKYLAIFALSLGLSACASTTPEKLKGAEHYFSEGQKAMGKNRCIEASEQFQRLVSNFPGSQRVAEAQFMLAEAYFCSEDWINSGFEYQRIVDIYPSSEWVTESQFKIGEAYFRQLRRAELDQKETFEALTAFRHFIEDHPDSPRVEDARQRIVDCRNLLAQKQYESGHLYHRQGHLDAAKITYEEVLRNYPDTDWYWTTLFRMGEIARAQDDVDLAVRYWKEVLQNSEDEELVKDVQKHLSNLDESAG